MTLSVFNRKNHWESCQAQALDLVVIGGGITGAGVALDAASRGLKVALFEMQDYAEGTSSRSTKLIHGGLRYLQQFKFKQVRDVGRERHILARNAPHLVWPNDMLVPVVRGGAYAQWQLNLGLKLYDRLAGVSEEQVHQVLDHEQVLSSEPLLNREIIQGGAVYTEYQTDDARLVISIIKKAHELGALCFNYAKVEAFGVDESGKINGVVVKDQIDEKEYQIRARQVVNCAGPWVDEVREKVGALKGKQIYHTKGVHLVFHHADLPVKQPCYFGLRDGRMIFVIPRGKYVYAGTTDTPYPGDLKSPQAEPDDKVYLLKAINRVFSMVRLTRSDIVAAWAGIRPLIQQQGKAPSEVSRKDEIFVHESGLLSIAGGKLTGYRLMAKKIVDLAVKKMGLDLSNYPCISDEVAVAGATADGIDWQTFRANMLADYPRLDQDIICQWLDRYGVDAVGLIKQITPQSAFADYRKVELDYCKDHEGVVRLSDFEQRRTNHSNFPQDYLITKTLSSNPSSKTIL